MSFKTTAASRLNFRLPAHLKAVIEEAAAQLGLIQRLYPGSWNGQGLRKRLNYLGSGYKPEAQAKGRVSLRLRFRLVL